MIPDEPSTNNSPFQDEQNPDLVELQRLTRLYPQQAWLAAAGEPERITVDDIHRTAAAHYPVVDWAAGLRDAPRSDLLKVIGALTRLREDWRQIGRDYAAGAGDPGNTRYLRTVRIARADVHLNIADALDEQIAGATNRGDLLGWGPAVESEENLSGDATAEARTARDD